MQLLRDRMHTFQEKPSTFSFLTYAPRTQVNISQNLYMWSIIAQINAERRLWAKLHYHLPHPILFFTTSSSQLSYLPYILPSSQTSFHHKEFIILSLSLELIRTDFAPSRYFTNNTFFDWESPLSKSFLHHFDKSSLLKSNRI